MNILYIVSQYPCFSETFIVREITELKDRGHEISIYSLKSNKEDFVQREALGFEDNVIYPKGILSQLKSLVWLVSNFKILFSFIGVCSSLFWGSKFQPGKFVKNLVVVIRTLDVGYRLKDKQLDHIHAHWANYPSSAALLLSSLIGKEFSFTSHAHDIYIDDHLMEKKLNACKFAVTISDYNKRYLENNYSYDSSKLFVIHCGVDPDKFVLRKEITPSHYLLSVGRLDQKKGFDVLIRAVENLVSQDVEIKCEIVGDGELFNELTALAQDLNVQDYISFVGAKDSDYINTRLALADLFVLPCKEALNKNIDGIPVVLMEAMASGTPVLSTRISGIPELVIDGETGYLVREEDFIELAEKIKEVLVADKAEIVSSARAMIETDFNIKTEVSKLERLMEE